MEYTFRVLVVTNDLEAYPRYKRDTIDFPELLEYVEDEIETFVFCNETEDFWKAGEFFDMVSIDTFKS